VTTSLKGAEGVSFEAVSRTKTAARQPPFGQNRKAISTMESEVKEGGQNRPLVLRGRAIRADENGLLCLNDIWAAAQYRKHKRPNDWKRLATTNPRILKVLALITGKSRNYLPEDMRRVYRTRRGPNGGTYADMRLALDYAEYLNPSLAIEVKEVFLRYKSADPTLADEIMQRNDAAMNEWMAKRSLARAARISYTATLKAHGLREPKEYAQCTNATYEGLFGMTASQLRQHLGLPANRNLRDAMDVKDLVTVSFTEVHATDRIEDEDCDGFHECRAATRKVAGAVRNMIEGDRKDRQKRLIG
jgi:hypothetical protein